MTAASSKSYKIAAIPGDGIGKEVVPEGIRVAEAAARRFGFSLSWKEFDWSCERCRKTDSNNSGPSMRFFWAR